MECRDAPAERLEQVLVALDQNSTIIAVIEMSQSSWLVAGVLPGIERQPRKKLEPNAERLLGLLHRWRDEAIRAGKEITRIAVAFEAGRDGFWLARWLEARGVEAHVIHPSSVAVSREHRRAKTDRLDTELLKRGFLGWLRGERGHCSMARVPTIAEEDAKRPNRERESLVGERTRIVNRIKATLARMGIRNFKPTLRKAAERLATVHTPEGMPLPPNVLAELQRDMARLGFVVSQIREIEDTRQKRLEQEPETAISRPENTELMTFQPEGGARRVNRCWQMPRSYEELVQRRKALQAWAHLSHGFLGRSPDHVASAVIGQRMASTSSQSMGRRVPRHWPIMSTMPRETICS